MQTQTKVTAVTIKILNEENVLIDRLSTRNRKRIKSLFLKRYPGEINSSLTILGKVTYADGAPNEFQFTDKEEFIKNLEIFIDEYGV